ncbi:MAG: hypothetical protein ACUVSL_16190 [Chloroflexus sp.]|uniref:hypothetical protein n=1 Tax=Chloroflexus sp. TaxID=1904827 RepID=UPI00404959D5
MKIKYLTCFLQTVHRRHIRHLTKIGVNVLLLVMLLIVILQNHQSLQSLYQLLSVKNVFLIPLLYLTSLSIQMTIWIDMIGYKQTQWKYAIDDFIQTYLMGRLPGGLWKWVGRITVYRAHHLSKTTAVWVNIMEVSLLITSGVIILLLLKLSSIVLQITVLGVYFLLVWLIMFLVAVIKPELTHWKVFHRSFFWCMGYSISWLLGSYILFLLVSPLSGLPFSLWDAVFVGILSGIAGQLLQFIPVSTLLRDLTLFALLGKLLTVPQIILVVFALRVMYSLSDIVSSWVITLAVSLIGNRKANDRYYSSSSTS